MSAPIAQLCPILCNSMDYSTPGFSVHEDFQERIPFPSRLSFPIPGDLLNSWIKPTSC